MTINQVDISELNKLPRKFEAYNIAIPLEKMINAFHKKHGYEPCTFYKVTVGKTKMMAIEVIDEVE
jgi:hypothetical protein